MLVAALVSIGCKSGISRHQFLCASTGLALVFRWSLVDRENRERRFRCSAIPIYPHLHVHTTAVIYLLMASLRLRYDEKVVPLWKPLEEPGG